MNLSAIIHALQTSPPSTWNSWSGILSDSGVVSLLIQYFMHAKNIHGDTSRERRVITLSLGAASLIIAAATWWITHTPLLLSHFGVYTKYVLDVTAIALFVVNFATSPAYKGIINLVQMADTYLSDGTLPSTKPKV